MSKAATVQARQWAREALHKLRLRLQRIHRKFAPQPHPGVRRVTVFVAYRNGAPACWRCGEPFTVAEPLEPWQGSYAQPVGMHRSCTELADKELC
jgi:hypothetical protein